MLYKNFNVVFDYVKYFAKSSKHLPRHFFKTNLKHLSITYGTNMVVVVLIRREAADGTN